MEELTVSPISSHFTASQENQLLRELEDLDRHSIMWPMTRPSDIILNSQAQIVSGQKFKLTSLALYQLCQAVCPGLFGFVREMSGAHRKIEEARADYSIEECVDIINRVVRRRFDSRLYGKILLRNTKHGTIDGVLSPGYKWLSNLRLYEMTKGAMQNCKPGPLFWEAQLNGRWLLLRYCNTKSHFTIDMKELGDGFTERFYVGYHFSNDELGRATVRGAPFLLRKNEYTVALPSLNIKGRVRHAGASFEERLTHLLARTTSKLPDAELCKTKMTELLNQNLGLGHKIQKEEVRARKKLAEKLIRKDVPITVAKKIIGSLCSNPNALTPHLTEFRNTDKTRFDLYAAMGREAKHLPIRLREAVEQLAYELLFNKVTLN